MVTVAVEGEPKARFTGFDKETENSFGVASADFLRVGTTNVLDEVSPLAHVSSPYVLA